MRRSSVAASYNKCFAATVMMMPWCITDTLCSSIAAPYYECIRRCVDGFVRNGGQERSARRLPPRVLSIFAAVSV
ncbi:unnamed protein product [Macrosiphum euphorbiae]|uniref:Secreted protein n=1 Tax=Macrosiphum euphorbiae TaxID=13131 RepID=A0AAV0VKK0_9HEMI|nr:unnamed protein product [Macrosiphum euphorbiae]